MKEHLIEVVVGLFFMLFLYLTILFVEQRNFTGFLVASSFLLAVIKFMIYSAIADREKEKKEEEEPQAIT